MKKPDCICIYLSDLGFIDGTILLPPKIKILSLQPYSVAVQLRLCRTWSEIPKAGFLRMQLE